MSFRIAKIININVVIAETTVSQFFNQMPLLRVQSLGYKHLALCTLSNLVQQRIPEG